jgi:hypothetical protein
MAAKRGRGRTAGFVMSDEHRTKIANSQILKCLIEHAEGVREMTATQVTAGLGLLRKVLPDLSQVETSAEVVHRFVARMPAPVRTVEEWQEQYVPALPPPEKTSTMQ